MIDEDKTILIHSLSPLSVSPVPGKGLHKRAHSGTADLKQLPFHHGAFILDALHMFQINQVTFIASGKTGFRQLFFH